MFICKQGRGAFDALQYPRYPVLHNAPIPVPDIVFFVPEAKQ